MNPAFTRFLPRRSGAGAAGGENIVKIDNMPSGVE